MRALVLLALAACGGSHKHATGKSSGPSPTEVTLYRDRALVAQRVELDIPEAGDAHVRVKVAAGVGADDLFVMDKNTLSVKELHVLAPDLKPAPGAKALQPAEVAERMDRPTEIEMTVGGPHAGHYTLRMGYTTDRITWDAAYTMTTAAARDRAVVRGAIAIRNTTGIALTGVRLFVVDADAAAAQARVAESLRDERVGTEPSTTPTAQPRDLGRFDLADGDTRIELLANAPSRRMRSVLVFDPIGTKLDHGGASPARELELGVKPAPPRRVTESFEIDRDVDATTGLPAGPVRLLERRTDGSLGVLGESRMFDVSTRVARVDTIAIGTAEGVTGKRERREVTIDDDNKRLTEEFVVTIENTRAYPVDVVLREHLYRGQNWTLAYQSSQNAEKEGPQQIALKTHVPAKGSARVLYVVVYTW